MTSEQRMQVMRERLSVAFAPSQLEIIDDSAQHVGHAGASGGAGHYTLLISAVALKGLSRVVAHRQIYAVLNDLIPHEVHALQIKMV